MSTKRAEARRQARLLGWRGSKAKHWKKADPAVAQALRMATQLRLAELKTEQSETTE